MGCSRAPRARASTTRRREDGARITKTETIRARVEPKLKAEAEEILDSLGVNPSDAILGEKRGKIKGAQLTFGFFLTRLAQRVVIIVPINRTG